MIPKIQTKQLSSGNNQYGRFLISDGMSGFTFYDLSGITYEVKRGTAFPTYPVDGDLFYKTDVDLLFNWDGSRTKWLTVYRDILNCGRSIVSAAGTTFMRVGDATQSSTAGFKMNRKGTIVGASVENDNILTAEKNVEVRVNNSSVNKVTLNIPISSKSISVDNSNLDFNAGDIIQVAATSGTSGSALSNAVVLVNVAYGDVTAISGETTTCNVQKGSSFPPIPVSGDLYYRTDVDLLFNFDSGRTKWVTIFKDSLTCGRANVTAGTTTYMRIGDATQSSTSGFKMVRNGTIIGVSVENDNVLTAVKNIEIRVNNSGVNKVTSTISIGNKGTTLTNANLDFSIGDLIQVVAVAGSTGSALNNVIVVVNIAFRI